jgi:hypothetical protein
MTDSLSRKVRLGRGGALVAGAAVYAALVYGPLEFYWTPFLLGVAYLGAATAGGRRGGLWATGLVLTGWGVGVLLRSEFRVDLSAGDAYLLGVGAAALVAGLLARSGFSVDLVGVGATAFAAGLLHTFAHQGNALTQPWPYVALLAVVGAVNVALAFVPQSRAARGPSARTEPRAGTRAAARQAAPTA